MLSAPIPGRGEEIWVEIGPEGSFGERKGEADEPSDDTDINDSIFQTPD